MISNSARDLNEAEALLLYHSGGLHIFLEKQITFSLINVLFAFVVIATGNLLCIIQWENELLEKKALYFALVV